MNLVLLAKTVFSQLSRYRTKSFFMMLGIIISVTAIVLVQTIGNNVREKFYTYINQSYPADTVFLAAGNGFMGGGRGRDNLKLSDINVIVNSVGGIVDHDPIVHAGKQNLTSFGNNARSSVVGVSPLSEQARNRSVVDGRFITGDDVRKKSQVALIGSTVSRELFPNASPLGMTVFYNNVSFEVIGELESVGADPHGGDADDVFYIPYTTLMSKMLKRDYFSGTTFILEEYDPASVDEFVQEVSEIMRERHLIDDAANDDFSLISPKFMFELVDDVISKFNIIVPILSVIVFLISGIVILNIMLVVIKERVPEIGLRKALGATPEDLRLQIFLEMLVICVIGAIVGLILSNVILFMLQPIFNESFGIERIERSLSTNAYAMCLALICGLLSAIIPAQRAAKLNPVTALA